MKVRAIVFDDDDMCRTLIANFLQQRGYEVVCLPDPMAFPLYQSPKCTCSQDEVCCDFLLTDNRMPKMTGLELIDRQASGGCKKYVGNKAVLSGSLTEDERQKARRLGCKVFHKPYKLEEIAAWLDLQEMTISPDRKLAKIDFDENGPLEN
ncbi:response regulator [Syntrophotalea carbinolica DSM 2380]|uniref:Response regulator n=1 Tax=Syntrophotalea carbinolica (strain DSM 2380 / NBRC 103641 / GraBd1) TaxID=338963 RepID=Q3A4W7_SYNC1|nr:response regulator [Syntrophotalea carbinolica]ABA88590.1 response regulator [Syntrophotalea carbinolica DSM 2380]